MAEPNRPPLNIDDAENIRRFSSQIRGASGQRAFPSSREQVNADGSFKPSSGPDSSDAASLGSPEQENADSDQALKSSSTLITPEVATPDLPPHPIFDHVHRLTQLPRAVQQLRDESPSLNGIEAPHSTPESFKPSPITGVQHLPEPSNEEIGMAINEVLSSLPSAGKYGIDDSMWATRRGPRPKVPYGPKYTDKDTQLVRLSAHQGNRTEKEEFEARERAKEHNQTFERMSFKIADAPSLGKAYAGNTTGRNALTPESVSQGKELSQLPQPLSTKLNTNLATQAYRSVGTQTTDEDFVMASQPNSPVDTWVRIDSPIRAFVSTSAGKTVSSLASEFKRVAGDVGKAFDKMQQPGYQPTVADLEAVSVLGYTLGFLKCHMGNKVASEKGLLANPTLKAVNEYTKSSEDAYDGLKVEASPVEEPAIFEKEESKFAESNSSQEASKKPPGSEPVQPQQSDMAIKDMQAKKVVEDYSRAQMDITPPAEERVSPKKGLSPNSILAAGMKFAKSRQNAYGAPKSEAITMREPEEQLPDSLLRPTEQPQLAIEVPAADVGSNSPRMPSGPSLSALTPSSMEFTLASPAAVAAAGIAASRMASQKDTTTEGDREKALYFGMWGKPEARPGPAPQKRNVILSGDPAWDSAPTPSFIADLVFGGPLEQIHCMEHTAKVTFLDGADAKRFVDATPNDILFKKDAKDATRNKYAVVKWVEDVTPMSSLVQQYIDNGVTRCVQAIGTADLPLDTLKATAGGKLNRMGLPMRKVENVDKGINARGHHTVTFRFCDIRDAVTFKAEMARDEQWETANMQYTTDPCSGATSANVV